MTGASRTSATTADTASSSAGASAETMSSLTEPSSSTVTKVPVRRSCQVATVAAIATSTSRAAPAMLRTRSRGGSCPRAPASAARTPTTVRQTRESAKPATPPSATVRVWLQSPAARRITRAASAVPSAEPIRATTAYSSRVLASTWRRLAPRAKSSEVSRSRAAESSPATWVSPTSAMSTSTETGTKPNASPLSESRAACSAVGPRSPVTTRPRPLTSAALTSSAACPARSASRPNCWAVIEETSGRLTQRT